MKLLRYMREGISHLVIIFAAMLLTFWVTDRFNTAMAFINHPMTKGLMGLFVLCAVAVSLFLLLDRRSALRAARLGVGIFNLILSAYLFVLLVWDLVAPERVLFGSDLVKFYLLGTVICAIAASVFGICCRRMSLEKTA